LNSRFLTTPRLIFLDKALFPIPANSAGISPVHKAKQKWAGINPKKKITSQK